MDEIILKDDFKKEKVLLIFLLIFLIIIVALAFIFEYLDSGQLNFYSNIIVAVFLFLLLCLWVERFISCCLYKLEVTKESIVIKTIKGKGVIPIINCLQYSYKIYNPFTNLYVFKIIINGKVIKIFTHFYSELDKILKTTENNPT